jgi:phosphate/sulfate permease
VTDPMSMDALQAYAEEQSAMVTKVLAANPGLPVITAHIIAGDLMSAERATQRVAEGMPAEQAVNLVGSYARWDWALQMVAEGVLSEQWFQDNLPHLWSGAIRTT